MYTLRSITEEGNENNLALGSHYSFISRKKAPEAFNRVYKDAYDFIGKYFEGEPDKDCIGMIQAELQNFIFVWEKEKNYIMTESGKTFSNLTNK